MSTLSKLFSGYTGGGHTAKNGKFSTTKNNHNRDKYGRPTVYYVVIGEYMISFDGDVNCGERPMGWYYTHETGSNDNELPMECVKVYRPKHITHTFIMAHFHSFVNT